MTEINLNDFRERIEEVLARVADDREETVITRVGAEPMAVLPLADLRSLRETLHLLSTPANADRLQRSVATLDAGSGLERPLSTP